MKTNKQKDIAVPKSGFKRSALPWSHDVNTTFSWGEIQPTMSQLLIPNSKTIFKPQSLTRLAPMVAPTFGRVKYKTYSQFVPVDSVFPNYDAMVSREPVSTPYDTRVPKSIPYAMLGRLSSWVFHGARATIYWIDPSAPNPQNEYNLGHFQTEYKSVNFDGTWNYNSCPTSFSVVSRLVSLGFFDEYSDPYANAVNATLPNVGKRVRFYPAPNGQTTPLSPVFSSDDYIPLGLVDVTDLIPVSRSFTPSAGNSFKVLKDYQKEVTFESADYVVEIETTTDDNLPLYVAICFEFSDFGKRIRKILQGCNFQIDLASKIDKRLDVLLAQFKAYFDVFGLTLYQGWETSYCYKFIQYVKNNFLEDVNTLVVPNNVNLMGTNDTLFIQWMILEVGNEWYTDDTDYISAHMEKLAVSPKIDKFEFISVDANGHISDHANITDPPNVDAKGLSTGQLELGGDTIQYIGSQEVHGYINKVQHGQVDATLLERLYYWTNKHSILGRSIRKLMDVFGLGKYIDPTHSQFIGNTDDMITISDVVALASTTEASLGEYGGRGLSFNEGRTIVLENDRAGFWVTLACIVPEAGYVQGIPQWMNDLTATQQYQADFDALGMEATKKEAVVGVSYLTTIADNHGAEDAFGFIPRSSRHKVMYNLVNGDFNRHGLRSVYLPYTLDKQLNINDYDVATEVHETVGSREFTAVELNRSPRVSKLPVAGNWARVPTKYGWLGNFARIFRRLDDYSDDNLDVSLSQLVGFADYNNDNFLVHSVLAVTCHAPCKPIENSYGLDEVDPNNVGVEYTSKA